jgi:hypothetical protein
MSSAFPTDLLGKNPGVHVIDASNPADPVLSDTLTSPAMVGGTWESLKVNAKRGLLGAVAGGPIVGVGYFSVYDISKDCAHPTLLNSFASTQLTLPANGLGHEGGWSPDGMTYYSAGLAAGTLTAIDVSNPTDPKVIFEGVTNIANHGFSISDNGDYLYISSIAPAGIDIFNISQIQNRVPFPEIKFVGSVSWSDGLATQMSIPITENGVPYLVGVDEFGLGGVRFINISDPAHPYVVSQIRLQIQLPAALKDREADNDGNGLFDYQSHYCTADREDNPTALACGYFDSGIRVFDIRNILKPAEIAYFNPPAQTGRNLQLPDSEHAMGAVAQAPSISDITSGDIDGVKGKLNQVVENGQVLNSLMADWCSSPPSFEPNDELWVVCQDNGFLALKFTNGVYPLP